MQGNGLDPGGLVFLVDLHLALERGFIPVVHLVRDLGRLLVKPGQVANLVSDEQDLVFVEVKTRRGTAFGLPEEAVTLSKRRKLVEVASYYLDLHSQSDRAWRIDVVAVQFGVRGAFEEIRVYQHAVSAE